MGPMLRCVVQKFGYLQNKVTSLRNFTPNSGLRKFRHDRSIVEMCCRLSSRKVDTNSVINLTVVGQLSWQYLRAPTLDRCRLSQSAYRRRIMPVPVQCRPLASHYCQIVEFFAYRRRITQAPVQCCSLASSVDSVDAVVTERFHASARGGQVRAPAGRATPAETRLRPQRRGQERTDSAACRYTLQSHCGRSDADGEWSYAVLRC